ncbi:MAG: OmpH family outer membrane protein [Bacteroidales bacterium]|nr:OmpH family outer membrane protein [Bacteroidales bacterium]MBO4567038.1 OmpH family outer membrane protein [Bacteroidales bacterium]
MKKILLVAALAMMSVAAGAQQKFAYVNFSELVQLMPEADQARATMDASSKEARETYQAMADEFNTKYQQYQQKAATWTQAIRESKEKELTDIQQRIQEFEQSVQAELQQQQQQLMAPIYKKAQDTLEDLAKKGGYVFVFDKGTALYVDPAQSDDLTPAARKALGIPDGRTLETLQAELQAQAEQQLQ